jgi:hypothetical protein
LVPKEHVLAVRSNIATNGIAFAPAPPALSGTIILDQSQQQPATVGV